MLDFALSNGPHFNNIHLVRAPFLTGIAVQVTKKVFPMFKGPLGLSHRDLLETIHAKSPVSFTVNYEELNFIIFEHCDCGWS